MTPGPVVRVAAPNADALKDALHRRGLLDHARRFVRDGAHVLVPVVDAEGARAVAREHGGDLAQAPAPPRRVKRTPHAQVLDLLGHAPAEVRAAVPGKWEKLGPVVTLRMPDVPPAWRTPVAEAFARVLGARCVLEDRAGVAGELREMRAAEIVWGEDPVAEHVEHGIRYRFDASRIMFSSGNVDERSRAAAIPARGEVVADMFAGIGYFTLPLAVKAGPARVVAMEKNPVSHRYLVENVRANDVEDVVEPWLGDNRAYPEEGFADRVLMGYFPGTEAFLPKALRLLKPGGGTLHYHDVAERRDWREAVEARVRRAAEDAGRSCEVRALHVVKSTSPSSVHVSAEARVH